MPKAAKLKKAPGAPRRFKSAYMYFSSAKHKEIRQQLGSEVKTPQVAKMVAKVWKGLTAEERKPWEELGRRDRLRYEVEKNAYTGPWKVPAGKAATPKDPTAPKRPMSAFLAFSNAIRGRVRREHSVKTNSEVSCILAQMWRALPVEERQRYLDEETVLRKVYKAKKTTWTDELKSKRDAIRLEREDEALQIALSQNHTLPPSSSSTKKSKRKKRSASAIQCDTNSSSSRSPCTAETTAQAPNNGILPNSQLEDVPQSQQMPSPNNDAAIGLSESLTTQYMLPSSRAAHFLTDTNRTEFLDDRDFIRDMQAVKRSPVYRTSPRFLHGSPTRLIANVSDNDHHGRSDWLILEASPTGKSPTNTSSPFRTPITKAPLPVPRMSDEKENDRCDPQVAGTGMIPASTGFWSPSRSLAVDMPYDHQQESQLRRRQQQQHPCERQYEPPYGWEDERQHEREHPLTYAFRSPTTADDDGDGRHLNTASTWLAGSVHHTNTNDGDVFSYKGHRHATPQYAKLPGIAATTAAAAAPASAPPASSNLLFYAPLYPPTIQRNRMSRASAASTTPATSTASTTSTPSIIASPISIASRASHDDYRYQSYHHHRRHHYRHRYQPYGYDQHYDRPYHNSAHAKSPSGYLLGSPTRSPVLLRHDIISPAKTSAV